MGAFRNLKAGAQAKPSTASDNYWQPAQTSDGSVESQPSPLAEMISSFLVVAVLAVMADSFFFTTWISFSTEPGGETNGIVAFLKIISSIVALAIAFLGPFIPAYVCWEAVTNWLDRRRADRQLSALSGCASWLPAAGVFVAGYVHFLLAYKFYEALGVLAHP